LQHITISLPWQAWITDGSHDILVPAGWHVDRLLSNDPAAMAPQEIARALDEPIDALSLSEIAAGRNSACIVIDDLARPTQPAQYLPQLVSRLQAGGMPEENIRIVIATGTHGPLSSEQIALKCGPTLAKSLRIESHDAKAPLADTNIPFGNGSLRINSTLAEAQVKVLTGAVLPHALASFGGGAKAVIPGLVDTDTAARCHKFGKLNMARSQTVADNLFRHEIELACRKLGIAFAVCIVPNRQRQIAGLFAGDFVSAHRRAAEFAATAYRTTIVQTYDCLIVNAYPKDIDLIQSEGALVSLKETGPTPVRPDGVIVLTTAASRTGQHGLFAPGGRNHVPPRQRPALANRELWLYAPNLSSAEARRLHWEGYPFFQDRLALLAALEKRLPQPAAAAVISCGPMQVLESAALESALA